MMQKTSKPVPMILLVLVLSVAAAGQSGGGFEITESVIAGGASPAANGNLELESTIGQPASGGTISGQPFAITSGFWNFTPLAPTAASATISGRVVTPSGSAIGNALLYLQTQNGEMYISRSSPMGYYMFEGIEAGQSVFITVEHKRFTFEPRTVMVADSVSDLDFTALPN